jgi:uncharacterized protein (TIGR02444 family)
LGEALWPFALAAYARPGAEAALLELQDHHGQCVPYLIWALWLAAEGRVADDAALADAAALARAWQDAAVAPLRGLRRDLRGSVSTSLARPRQQLRERVKALELEAERMLLQMLEAASPASTAPPGDAITALTRAVSVWGGAPPVRLLARLAAAQT